MPMFKTLNEQAKSQLDRLRNQSLSLYSKVLETGNERLDDLLRLSGLLGPGVRGLLEGRVERLQARLDELNQSLAQHAVPVDRKHRVGRMALDSKARQAGQVGLRVVSDQEAASPKKGPGDSPKTRESRKTPGKPAGTGTASAEKTAPKNKAAAKSKAAGAGTKGKGSAGAGKAGNQSRRKAGGKSPADRTVAGKQKTATPSQENGRSAQSPTRSRPRKSPAAKA